MHRSIARYGFAISLGLLAACSNEVVSPAAPEGIGGPRLVTGPASFTWKGVLWNVSTNADATIDGNGSAVLTRLAELPVPTGTWLEFAGDPAVNANGTPWMLFSYEDDAISLQGFDLFINHSASGPRLSAGSLFTVTTGIGYERYGTGLGLNEQVLFCAGCPTPARVAGRHTIYIGKRADRTTDMNFDGVWYSGTFLRDNQPAYVFAETMLRRRGGAVGTSAIYYDFRKGDNHPGGGNKDACKDGGWTASGLFTNQGQCVQYAITGK